MRYLIHKNGLLTPPKLEIRNQSLVALVSENFKHDSLIISDSFNYNSIKGIGQSVEIQSCDSQYVSYITNKYRFSRVLAVGGCTALDIGRACANDSELIVFPTVLSTNCISNDRSKLLFGGKSKLIKTSAPIKTVISIATLLETEKVDIIKWTQSGFGDFFANISASIDVEFRKNTLSELNVRSNVPETFEALNWVLHYFIDYDEHCLRHLARWLHNSSVETLKTNSIALSSGGEHLLYHKVFDNKMARDMQLATHGQIVAVGTLISTRIFSEITGEGTLFDNLKASFKKLGLPSTYRAMQKVHLTKDDLINAISQINNQDSLIGMYFLKSNFDILDRTFG